MAAMKGSFLVIALTLSTMPVMALSTASDAAVGEDSQSESCNKGQSALLQVERKTVPSQTALTKEDFLSNSTSAHFNPSKCDMYDGAWRRRAPLELNCPLELINKYLSYNWWTPNKLKPRHVHDETLSFEWVPRGCNLEPFNASAFSSALAGRSLYMIGDSITMQMWQTLACQISDEIDVEATKRAETEMWLSGAVVPQCSSTQSTPYCFKPGKPPSGDEQHPGVYKLYSGGQVELLTSDTLVSPLGAIEMEPYLVGGSRSQVAWAKSIIESSTPRDVIVLNTGAHIYNYIEFMKTIDEVFRWLKTNFKGKIIYRDSYPGIKNPVMDSPCIQAALSEILNEYGFSPSFNAGAKSTAMRLGMDVHFMEISNMMSMRCDRADYLHFQIPGAPVEWSRFLYSAMQQN
jgi:hypothetical protein